MYEKARIGIDPVIFTIHENKLKVLLRKREKEPFKKKYELFGGLIEKNENAKSALKRKLKEVLDTNKFFFKQFHTFTNPKRDPRMRTISIGYVALIEKSNVKNFNDWFDINKISQTTNHPLQTKLAFDHENIIRKATIFLKENLDFFAKHLLPDKFPLNMLQSIYEIILEEKFDNRNFRKQMINSFVKETEEYEKKVSHRPAKLYLFNG